MFPQPSGRRLAAALLLIFPLAGCGRYAAQLRQREVVVQFAPEATPAQHQEVLKGCSGMPNIQPEDVTNRSTASNRDYDVRFRIDNASDAQLGALLQCLGRYPFVKGYHIPDRSM